MAIPDEGFIGLALENTSQQLVSQLKTISIQLDTMNSVLAQIAQNLKSVVYFKPVESDEMELFPDELL